MTTQAPPGMSFRLKTILGVAVIEAVLLSILVFSGIRFLSATAESEFVQRTRATVKAFSVATKNALIASDLAAIEALTHEMLSYPGVVFARVRDANGTVVAAEGDARALAQPAREDQDVVSAQGGIFHSAATVAEANTTFGRVELGISSSELQQQNAAARRYGTALAALEMALVALFSWALGSYLTRQLVALKEGAKAVADGNLGIQLPVRGNDELAQTATAFNQMSAQLSTSYNELQQREVELRRVLNATHDGIVVIDEKGTVLSFNLGAEKMFGWKAEEVVGRNVNHIVPQPHAQHHDGYLRRHLETGQSTIMGNEREFEARRKDGSTLWIALRVAEMEISDQRRFIGVVHDITERKQAEIELRHAKALAEEAAVAKSDFLANMSHEIRTPMHGVLGSIEMLSDTPLTGQQERFLGTAKTSAHVLLGVIDEILDFSRLEAGKLRMEALDFDLRRTVEDVTTMLAQRAHSKHIELACFISPEVPEMMRGDPIRLRQILINLVGNAIKFTERGEVVVTCTFTAKDAGPPSLRFEVRDTGVGIAADKQDQLFQPFVQADNSTSRRFGGSGLGLSITRRLIDLMHGEIALESTEGRGSRFWFTLPFQAAALGVRLPRADSFAGTRVLVVDDNSTNRIILHRYLTSWSAQSSSATAGDEALAKLQDAAASGQPYEIALLDVNMPFMDGYDLVRAIQNDAALAAMPIIMLSSSVQNPKRLEGLRVDVWLDKPVRQSDLHDAMVTVLRGRAAESPSGRAAEQAAAMVKFNGERVLLVEDNPVTRELGLQMLRKRGLAVEVAETGMEAVNAVQRLPFDVVLMDIQMPGMDGYEATAAIRLWEAQATPGNAGRARLPIVAVTAHALASDRQRCLDAGMDDHVVKPYSAATLTATVARWLMPLGKEAPSVLDAHRLAEVRSVMGGEYTELLGKAGMALEAIQQDLQTLTSSIDLNSAIDTAHRIKNTAGDVGALRLRELAAQAERDLARGPLPAAAWEEISQQLTIVAAALRALAVPPPPAA